MNLASCVGIDLGTSTAEVCVPGRGLLMAEPSCVAVSAADHRKVLAFGREAYEMVGRTPQQIEVIFPVRGGVVTDAACCEALLSHFVKRAHRFSLRRPNVCVCIPCRITPVERLAVERVCRGLGASKVAVIEEPLAAAIGAGLPLDEGTFMVVDIGGGSTDLSVISHGTCLKSASLRTAGDAFNEDIIRYVRETCGFRIGELTAEQIKIEVGRAGSAPASKDAAKAPEELSMEVKGQEISSGLPKKITVTGQDVSKATLPSVRRMAQAVSDMLGQVPEEMRQEISLRGILLSGGGSLLRGLDRVLADLVSEGRPYPFHFFTRDDPQFLVAAGTVRYFDPQAQFDLPTTEREKEQAENR